MFKRRLTFLQACLLLACLASLQFVATPSRAQNEGLTFEQAQTRTSYARRQMESMRRELKAAEAEESSALRRVDELKKSLERAERDAESATQARESAEEKFAQARTRWSQEAERLKRIHESRESPLPAR